MNKHAVHRACLLLGAISKEPYAADVLLKALIVIALQDIVDALALREDVL